MSSCSVIAHRGFHNDVPENTIASFVAAARIYADMAELDVRLTRDGVPIIFHDAEIMDRSGKKHAINNLNFIHLRRLQIKKFAQKKKFYNIFIPTLKDVVKKILPRLALNIELKPEPGREAELVARVLKDIPAHHNPRIIYSSFSRPILRLIKLKGSSVRIGLLFKSDIHENLRWAKRNGCFAIQPKISVCNRALIEMAHHKGLQVIIWTVNNLHKAKQLQAWGADGLITDVPKKLLKEG